MKKRYLIFFVIFLVFVSISIPFSHALCKDCFDHTGDGIGDCMNGCEEGEDLYWCNDCKNAVCGDGKCDYGLNEDDYGTSDYCQEDCGLRKDVVLILGAFYDSKGKSV